MIRTRASLSQPQVAPGQQVVLLDCAEGAALACLYSLAPHYHLQAVAVSPGSAIRFSRRARLTTVPHWDWESGPAQLTAMPEIRDGAVLFPLTAAATRWAAEHRLALQEHFRLVPLPASGLLRKVENKNDFCHIARQKGYAVPPHTLPSADEEVWRHLHFPVLLKPVSGASGGGIVKFESAAALQAYLHARPRSAPSTAPCADLGQEAIIQSYVPGLDLSCGVLCHVGRVVAMVIYQCLDRIGEYGPFRCIVRVHNARVETIVTGLLADLEWNGLINIDLRLTPQGEPLMLEANARPWWNMLAGTLWGVNLPHMACSLALGQVPATPISPPLPLECPQGYFGLKEAWRQSVTRSRGVDDTCEATVWSRVPEQRTLRQRMALLRTQSILPCLLDDPLPHIAWFLRRVRQAHPKA